MNVLNAPTIDSQHLAQEIATLWNDWERAHEAVGLPVATLCRDGTCDLESYRSNPTRVLVILKEPNNAGRDDLLAVLKNGPVYPVWNNVARWAGGVLLGFPSYEDVCADDRKRASLRSIAAINLKKQSGGSSSDMTEIHAHAYRDRALILRQIDLLSPTIVIACGTLDPLIWLLDLDVRTDGPIHAKTTSGAAFSVLPCRHPAAWGSSRKLYDDFVTAAKRRGYATGPQARAGTAVQW